MDVGGFRNRAFLSEEAQYGGPLGRSLLLLILEDMLRKSLDTGISLDRGPVGEPGGGGIPFPGLSREKDSISGFLSWTQRTIRY